MKVNEVVLIIDENEPRNDWSMGVVVKVEPDSKGFVRSAVVKTETGVRLTAEDRMDTADESKDADKLTA